MPLEDQAHPNPHGLRQERGTTPQMVGRYPTYDVLTQTRHWDDVTRRVILDRVENVPEIEFFTPSEVDTLKAFCDVVTAQDEEPRIPVLSYVDQKLAKGTGDGYQYFDLPTDGETWRRFARGLDEEAQRRSYESYAAAPLDVQVYIVHDVSQAKVRGGTWETLNVGRAWSLVMRYVVQAFYSHPWAWNEIGFGGPAYPRGYGAFGSPYLGERESWEASESAHYDPVRDAQKRGLD
ncbi:MAG TPA: gluconate 2-dehydrogenase subunit 3 family protein [Gaiellaceae bacterium]|nr:gluconate 2-dehydrogenase subunit 3 family protein [Gaiellaceae bacterium]